MTLCAVLIFLVFLSFFHFLFKFVLQLKSSLFFCRILFCFILLYSAFNSFYFLSFVSFFCFVLFMEFLIRAAIHLHNTVFIELYKNLSRLPILNDYLDCAY